MNFQENISVQLDVCKGPEKDAAECIDLTFAPASASVSEQGKCNLTWLNDRSQRSKTTVANDNRVGGSGGEMTSDLYRKGRWVKGEQRPLLLQWSHSPSFVLSSLKKNIVLIAFFSSEIV